METLTTSQSTMKIDGYNVRKREFYLQAPLAPGRPSSFKSSANSEYVSIPRDLDEPYSSLVVREIRWLMILVKRMTCGSMLPPEKLKYT